MMPKVQLLFGDTAGVGPELAVKVATDLPPEADGVQVILTGDGRVFKQAQQAVGTTVDLPVVTALDQIDDAAPLVFWDFRPVDSDAIPRAQVSEAAGREVLTALLQAIELAKQQKIHGIVFAPFNKESMHLAGAKHYSEFDLFKEEFNRPDIPGEFNILDEFWLGRVTSHIPVSQIAEMIEAPRISHTIELLAQAQERAGIAPRIAVAALNPHAGEHGMFGDEEGRHIEPAIQEVRGAHPEWYVDGPHPADTLFPRVLKGGYTGIVGMYHDQLQIGSKLIGLERGVTLHPGMGVPIATAAHGTAFDLQGTGKAKHTALRNALAIVAGMAAS